MALYPKGSRYTALEKNVLKYRAYEMVLILFQVQDLRDFVVDSIRASERFQSDSPRLPERVKQPVRKAWEILVEDGIITPDESTEIQALIDYRNVIAHSTERLTVDVNLAWERLRTIQEYDRGALERLESLSKKIKGGMAAKYQIVLTLKPYMFKHAERTFKEELGRLGAKLRRQIEALQDEIDEVNANISSLPKSFLEQLEPFHPTNRTASGTLSERGVECCYALFRAGATPLAVAYLMRLSLQATKARFRRWEEEAGLNEHY